MKKFNLFSLTFACAGLLIAKSSLSQCTIIPNAVPGITLAFSVGVNNGSGVAYNPNLNLYYIAQAGNAAFPLQTFSSTGAPLFQTNTGFDMRGLWWNSNTNQLESNGFNTGGIWAYNLNANGYGLNTGTAIFTGLNQPTTQSVGDYNCVDNQIWYYDNGAIMKRNRANNALIGTFPLVGLPVGTANLNNNTVFYTDCQGHEIGVLDYVLKRVYFFNKTTMAYSGFSQLPATAVTSNAFRASWANGLLWLFDTGPDIWYSYQVLSGFNTSCSPVVCTPPILQTTPLTVCSPNSVNLNNGIAATSGTGNATFYSSAANAAAGTSPISNIVTVSGTYYVRYQDPSDPTCFSQGSIVVTINPIFNSTQNLAICLGDDFTYPDGTTSTNITANASHTSNLLTVQGCDSIIVTNLTVNPIYDLVEDVSVCEGTDYTYPDGTIATILANTTHTSNLLTLAGCDSIIVTNVTMIALPDPGTDGTLTICSDDAAVNLFNSLGGTPDPGGTWSPLPASGTSNFNPSVDPSGTYTYAFNNSCGTFSAAVVVTVNQADAATIAYGNTSYCETDSDPMATITGTLGGAFSISGGGVIDATTGTIDITASGPGTYQVTYTTNGSCPTTATVSVNVLPNVVVSIASVADLCSDDNPITLTASPSGGTWSGSGVNASSGVFDPSLAIVGANTITYSVPGTCGGVGSIVIEVIQTPTVSTIADTTVQEGQAVVLTTLSTGNQFSWSPDTWLNCSTCQSPTATPESTTLYTVIADNQGCTSSTQVLVTVVYDPSLYVPNIFSPNGDGNNDVLYVRGQGIRDLVFVIYDRWGEKVFESTDKSYGWDGVFRDKKMNPGVFVYYVKATYYDNTEAELKGDVTLIR